ncbi:MAG: TonB-dependent receptor [Xanthobacteraceae bacterium]
MSGMVRPGTLRALPVWCGFDGVFERNPTQKVTVGCLIAVAAVSAAEAQEQPLPPVTVDAPIARPKPAAAKPSPEQIRARNALRRIAREKSATAARAKLEAEAAAKKQAAQQDPYADPAAPYKADRLASPKFSEPIANTPKSITVLTREVLDDKDATSLKDVARTTAGVTIGTGEGGNAFGDRFFIRGFDARNDVFVDGIRDPAVNIRENFFTEQIEILKGPSSTIDGRGTTGGALNIVTKQATTEASFYNADSKFASDNTKRVTFDVNQVISPTLAIRMDGMWQNANVSERDFTTDDRWGGLAAAKWTPTSNFSLSANYIHTNLNGLPDFGVPYNTVAGAPVTSLGVPRETYYGFVNRDFQIAQQDIGTLTGDFRVNDFVVVTNKFRDERSVLNYIGTIPEQGTGNNGSCNSHGGNFANPNPANWMVCLNPLSRYQVTDVLADQSFATIKFDTGPVRNTLVTGAEISRETVSIDSYNGLNSEAVGAGAFASGTVGPVSVLNPPNFLTFGTPTVTGDPNIIPVNTKSLFGLETANYRDFLILTAGLRFDNYQISASKAGYPTVSDTSNMWNYNLGIVVKPIPIASVYAAYGTSSEPVGAELDGTSANYGGLNPSSPINQIFSPVEAKAAEVGTKWELLDRHLLATAALFRTDVSNARELIPAGYPNAGTIQAGAAYHVQGIDLGAEGKLTEKWSLYGGVVLMNNRVDASAVPTNVGLPLAFIANQSFNLLTKYKVNQYLEVGGQATYRSKIYGGTLLAADQGTKLPDYWRFDAFVEGYFLKHYEWKIFVNNIFDKLYYDAFYQSAAPFVLVAPGRVIGGMMTARF